MRIKAFCLIRKMNKKNFVVYVHLIHTIDYKLNFSKENDSILAIEVGMRNIWIKTSLNEFGFKCIANKHELCSDYKCKCLCH